MDLDNRLRDDCHILGSLDSTCLLLSKNALFPWLILVPDTMEIEFYKLDQETQLILLNLITRLSAFIEKHFQIDKINIATIGNVVSQMHVHIVGRSVDDPCWPGVVWGCDQFSAYTDKQLKEIRSNLEREFTGELLAGG